jgi:glycosyltransferase involved in cell wall biosynthesis
MVEEDLSGFIFREDASLRARIEEIRELDLMRQTVGNAARIRAHELFDVEQRVAEIAQRYRDIVDQEL